MGAIGPIQLILSFFVIFGTGFCWWKIFSKAGYAGALGLLMFVPLLNIIMFLFLALGDWPSLREQNTLE